MVARSESNEIRIVRVYEAPVEAVWDAWTDPEQVAQWWGPRGFTLTTHSKDFRVGGTWRYTMHGPDGTDYENVTPYLDIEPLKKLVYDHGASDDRPPLFRVTVLFTEVPGGTQMDMTMRLPTPEEAEATRQLIKKAGGNATWDRLAEYLGKTRDGKDKFVINRSFPAPLETMYEMWTDPQHIAQWLPPAGFQMEFLRTDMRVGGNAFWVMQAGDMKMYGRFHYLELDRPRRIVYTQQFCDEHENVSRHPGAPTWPETMLTTVELTAEGPDETRVTVTTELYEDVRAEELQAFIAERGGMTLGWTGSFDKLEELLGDREPAAV